ncbi:MAG: helix-turn-helix transcriptional regulator [Deltaproteobacteria bacterium]|nr:helix-turn-helix transcriptional regulator [Deltaproteobacteria bacterium]
MTIKRLKDYSDDKFLEKLLGQPLTLGLALVAIRETLQISQADFADKLGISRARLCDIEKARRSVSLETAAQFAKRLGHPVEVFVKLAFQDQIERAKFKLRVEVLAA